MLQQRLDAGTIGGTFPNIAQSHDAVGIDQNVPSELMDVSGRQFRHLPAGHEIEVLPNRRRPPDVPNRPAAHAVRVIELKRFVHQNGPRRIGFANIRLGDPFRLKGDYDDAHA